MLRRPALSIMLNLFLATLILLPARPCFADPAPATCRPRGDRTRPVITILSPGNGQVVSSSPVVLSGSATDNRGIRVAGYRINRARWERLTLDGDGGFSILVPLKPGINVLRVGAIDLAGNIRRRRVVITYEEPSIGEIEITSPSNGDIIQAGHVDVTGIFRNPVITLGTTWGLPRILDGTFLIQAVPLPEGEEREITVTGYDADGTEYQASVTVSSSAQADPLNLLADTAGGETPLIANFSLENNTSEDITSCEIDFEGTGKYTSVPGCWEGFSHVYVNDEVMAPIVRVETSAGHSFSAQTFLSPYGKAQLVSSFPSAGPVDLEVDKDGRLFVLEKDLSRVLVVDDNGDEVGSFGSAGSGPGQFTDPTGLGIDYDGNIYVADAGTNKIHVFSPELAYVTSWGTSGEADGEINYPMGIGVEFDGSVLVADTANGRAQWFDSDGTFQQAIDRDLLEAPIDVQWAGGVNLYVADAARGEVLIFSKYGSVVDWEVPPPLFSSPAGLGFDWRNGWLLVADEAMNRVTFIDGRETEGMFLRHIEEIEGDERGLSHPLAVARASSPVDDVYYIADAGNGRVVKVALPNRTPEAIAEVWNSVRSSLGNGDIDAALEHFSPYVREMYGETFAKVGTQMPEVLGDMETIYPLDVRASTAIYGILRYEDGKPFLYEIRFEKDTAGTWRIVQW